MKYLKWLSVVVWFLIGCANRAMDTTEVSEYFANFVEALDEVRFLPREVLKLGEVFVVDDFEILLHDEVRFLDGNNRFDAFEIFSGLESLDEEIPGVGDALTSIFESQITAGEVIFYIPLTITNLRNEPRNDALRWVYLNTFYYRECSNDDLGWLAYTTFYHREVSINDLELLEEDVIPALLMEYNNKRDQLTNRQLVELNLLMRVEANGLTVGRIFPDSVHSLSNRAIEAGVSIDVNIYISYTEDGYYALRFFTPDQPENTSSAVLYDFIFRVER